MVKNDKCERKNKFYVQWIISSYYLGSGGRGQGKDKEYLKLIMGMLCMKNIGNQEDVNYVFDNFEL